MGRMKRTDTHFHFRADSEDMGWFKDFCQKQGTTASEEVRKWIQSLRRKDQRAKRNTQES